MVTLSRAGTKWRVASWCVYTGVWHGSLRDYWAARCLQRAELVRAALILYGWHADDAELAANGWYAHEARDWRDVVRAAIRAHA